MTTNKCPKCSAEFTLGTKFCQSCGCNLANEFIENPICPKCNKKFPSGTKFCDADGAKLVSPDKMIPQCVKCGKVYEDGTKFCPDDGGQVISEALRKTGTSINDWIGTNTKTGTLGKIALGAAIAAAVIDLIIVLCYFSNDAKRLGGIFVGKGNLFVLYLKHYAMGWIIFSLLLAGAAKFINGALVEEEDKNSQLSNKIAYLAGGLAAIFLILGLFSRMIVGY